MILLVPLFIALAITALRGLIFQWIWNMVAVDLFAVPELTFFYAVGLLILGSLLTSPPATQASVQKVKS